MRLLRFVPIKLTAFLILGILVGTFLNIGISFSFFLSLFLIAILAMVFLIEKNRKSPVFGITTYAVTISMGILSIALSTPSNLSSHYSKRNTADAPEWKLKVAEVLKPTSFSNRYFATIIAVDGKKASGKILLNQSIDSSQVKLGVDDELFIIANGAAIKPPVNPHQFDYQKYMRGLGISDQIRLTADNYFLENNSKSSVFGLAAKFRSTIISNLKKEDFGEEELSIIQALLLGQRNDISVDTYNDYKNAGAVHILAVSGLHIGILLLLLQLLLRPLEYLPHGRKLKLVSIVALLWGFAFIAGLSASIIRAVTMFTFVAYAIYLNRPSNTFNILALSMFFILLVISPRLLFQVGFQMSYAAVFAIVWIYPLLQKFWSPKNLILKKVWQLLSVSAAAQLGVLPISLFYFHQFPGLFFVSNLLIVPALGIILGLGILVIVLATFNILPDFLVSLYNSLIGWMNSVIGWVAEQEAFVFKNISFDAIQLVLAYVLLITLILFCSKRSFKRTLSLGFSIVLFQIYFIYIEYESTQKENLFLAHQTKNTVLLKRKGKLLYSIAHDTLNSNRIENDFAVSDRITSVQKLLLKNSYEIENENLYIMDSLAIYPPPKKSIDYIILTQSPKVNLERLIDSAFPKQIIADGSNYKSYIDRWKQTCAQRKIPFHYTGEKGAYYFDLKNDQ